MKKVALLLVAAASLAFAASASATGSSSCSLVKISYNVQSVFGTNYMFVRADTRCLPGAAPIYKWEIATTAPLTAWPYRQYTGDRSEMRFPVFYRRNSAGRKVLTGAGVTFMVGVSQYDYTSCTIDASRLRGVVLAQDCLPSR